MEVEKEVGSLRPNQHIQKILLSTPAHFVGEFDAPDLLLTHAWPSLHSNKIRRLGLEDSLNRTAIVLAFRTPPPSEPALGAVIPNYERAGQVVASALCVLFGKRFDTHGSLEMSGFFGIPEFSAFATPCDPRLIHNNAQPRADRSIPLNLSEVRRIAPLLMAEEDPRVDAFHSAAKFYHRALTAVEVDAESAYLNLITAGEIVSNLHVLSEEAVLDSQTRFALDRIAKELGDGEKIAKFLRGRLRGVKRRFVHAITEMLDDSFFNRKEAEHPFSTFRKADFSRRIAAAYDLRSRFVHSGYPFGGWIRPRGNDEVQAGKPVVPDTEMAKILALAPLFTGLERVIRYVLLTFAAELGADVESS